MTTHDEGSTPADDDNGSTTDFTAIAGVGTKTSAALNGAGISSMAALAAMSVGQVVRALEAEGVQISAGKIVSQLWLQQAWMLSSPSEPTETASSTEPLGEAAPDDDQPDEATEDGVDWQEQFGLFVYLDRSAAGDRWRTRIWDTADLVEEQLPGIAPGLLIDRLIDRVRTLATDRHPTAPPG